MTVGHGERLTGREQELTRLAESVRLLADGRGGLGWVRGEPGIGKSMLVDVVAARARQAGCTVHRATGDELAQAFPLRLVADAFGVSTRSPDPALTAIARLLRGEGSAADPVLAAGERLLEHIDRLCTAGPVVLVTEDLQFADEPSLLLWNRLARAVDQIPLLLLATSRPAPYRATVARLHDLARERGGELVDLGPLGTDDVREVAGHLLGGPPGPLLTAELARAGGNPLYVRELVDSLVRDGLVRDAEFHGESGAVPDSLAVAIGRRLRFPSADTADVLRIAALLGNDFGVEELSIVTGRSAAGLSTVVEEAIAAGAVLAVGTRLAFRHEVIRQVLVGQASQATLDGLHSHLAKELADAGHGLDAVARHLLAGPETTERWVIQWLAGVPEAMLYAVPQVAAELLTRAVRTIGADDPAWAVLAGRAAQVSYWLGRDDEAARLAREVARHTDDIETAATMTILGVRAAGRSGRTEDALAMATAPVDDRVPLHLRARLGAWSAIQRALLGQADAAVAAVSTALDEATRSGDPLALGYTLHASTLVADAPTAVDRIDRALAELGDDPESTDLRLLLTNNRLTYLAILGRWDDVAAALPPVLVLAERAGTFRAAGLLATAAEVGYMHGDWDDALVHLGGIDAEFRGNRANLNSSALGALIALHRGDRDAAAGWLPSSDESFADLARLPANWRLAAAWSLDAEVVGESRQALDRLSTLLEHSHVPGQRTRQELMPHLVRLALSVGDRHLADAVVAMCQADADAAPQTDRIAAAQCCQALRDGDAEGLLAAGRRYGEHGWPLQRALALEEAAVLLAQDGEPGRARTAFTDALNAYHGLGATWDLRRVEARLRPFGIRRGPRSLRRRATSGWDALTPAETRVARLVARGMSNPDIADELFLSRRTVQTHVSNILAKLALRSRVEIMREAAGR
ncbi:helix-turn-helix transcriptional regulator [Actinophytocola oryzae]|uniref:Regulatory LuxR family protein n=1 Tax=Actinophytocola oryzae TaxID=502181 RepID=A0A4R7V0X6_9PSEU|nr:LuxR family transcriptional regulator [Actinophytocola oryzae]TDV42214.1 regulatory LuxR family protein [Actinophytocola oryzae]